MENSPQICNGLYSIYIFFFFTTIHFRLGRGHKEENEKGANSESQTQEAMGERGGNDTDINRVEKITGESHKEQDDTPSQQPSAAEAHRSEGGLYIHLCTTFGVQSIKALEERLIPVYGQISKKKNKSCQILTRELQTSELDHFEFPSEMVKSDVMILCHSLANKEISGVVLSSTLYEKYLLSCQSRFGKFIQYTCIHEKQQGNNNVCLCRDCK